MHIIVDEDAHYDEGEGKAPRTYAEKKIKRVNTFVMVVQFTCFLITITDIAIRSEKTFVGDMWYPDKDDLALTYQLQTALINCSYTGTIKRGGWTLTNTITYNTSLPILADTTGKIRVSLLVNAFAIFAGSINKVLFDLNTHDIIRLGRLRVKKQLLMGIEFVLIIWAIAAMEGLEDSSLYLHKWISGCGVKYLTIFSVPPFVAMYVGHGVVLLMHGVTFWLLLLNAYRTRQEVIADGRGDVEVGGPMDTMDTPGVPPPQGGAGGPQ
eukprot:PhF_6_TR3683/c0_g1_i1/m.5234